MKGRVYFFLIGLLPFFCIGIENAYSIQKVFYSIQGGEESWPFALPSGWIVKADNRILPGPGKHTGKKYNVDVVLFYTESDACSDWKRILITGVFSSLGEGTLVSKTARYLNAADVYQELNDSCAQTCPDTDTDGDGICDVCDQKPGEQDPEDCIVFTTSNKSGIQTSWTIDPGCSGNSDNYEYYESDSYSKDDYFDIFPNNKYIPPKNCYVTDDNQCGCRYQHSNNGPGIMYPDPGGGDPGGGDPGGGDPGGGEDVKFTGNAPFPPTKEFDSSIDDLKSQVEEKSLAETVGNFISNGLPLVGYFKGTALKIGSTNPKVEGNLYGQHIEIDFSTVEGELNKAGLILVFIATVLAFLIIVKR